MRLIAVDIGNSATKFGIALNGRIAIRDVFVVENDRPINAEAMHWLSIRPESNWSICSVNNLRTVELQNWLRRNRPNDRVNLIQANDIDLVAQVDSRESLGRDRLVGAWRARQLYPQGALVVIDAGTAVTIDLVDAQSVFQGGLIFPGARTMLKILAKQTAALPDLSKREVQAADDNAELTPAATSATCQSIEPSRFPVVGRSTQQAILLGVYQTQLSTLVKVVEAHRERFGEPLSVITTGGGMPELRRWLPQDWQHHPHLVLEGALSMAQDALN
jgi:type III pantothenate kinase